MNKREDHISWDEYFMGVAILSSMRSKDKQIKKSIRFEALKQLLSQDVKDGGKRLGARKACYGQIQPQCVPLGGGVWASRSVFWDKAFASGNARINITKIFRKFSTPTRVNVI